MHGNRLESIQTLRGIAAMLVVLVHGSNNILSRDWGDNNFFSVFIKTFGDFGVDIFFVLSGFVMLHSLSKYNNFKTFFMGRIVRILPMVWFFIFILLLVNTLSPSSESIDYDFLLKSIFLLPVISNENGLMLNYLGPAWSLSYEFVLYLTLFLFFYAKNFKISFFQSIGVVSISLLVLVFFGYFFANLFFNTLLLEFVFGFLVYKLWVDTSGIFGRVWSLIILVASGCLMTIGLFLFDHYQLHDARFLYFGIPACGVLIFFMAYEISGNPFRILGDISYSLYLSHMAFTIHFYGFVVDTCSFMIGNYWIQLFIFSSLSIVFGYIFYRYIERPVTVYLSTRILK